MTQSRISADAPSTIWTLPIDFTFKGVAFGPATGASVPIYWNNGTASINWAFSFATIPGTGTSGAFVINCPDLVYLPDQYFGFVLATNATYQISLAAGKMTSTAVLTQGARITVIGVLTNAAIITL